MPSVSNKVSKKNVSFTLPVVVYNLAVLSAQSNGQTLAAWMRNAIASAARKWKTPAGDTEAAALFCNHPACLRPASACKRPTDHKAQDMWGAE